MTPARQLIIASETGKGRSFTAALLAYILADNLWQGGKHDENYRPAWMMIAASEHEATPFVENLRAGRRAVLADGSKQRNNKPAIFECLRSAGYRFEAQRHPEGTVWQAYLPDLFRLDPGMVDPQGITFIVSPLRDTPEWHAATAPAVVAPAVEHIRKIGYFGPGKHDRWESYDKGYPYPTPEQVRELAPLASFFAVYLARRTRAPLIPDPRFYLQLLIAMLREGAASLTTRERYANDVYFGEHTKLGFVEEGIADVGLVPGVACKVKHDDLEAVLAEQVAIYVREVN